MTENNRARFSSFMNILICFSLAVKMSQGPSFLQRRVHYFPPYLTQKLTKPYQLITKMRVCMAIAVFYMHILLSCFNC